MRFVGWTVVLVGGLIFSTATYAKTMSADEINTELIGKTLCAKAKDGSDICAVHSANGTSKIVVGPKQNGKWRFQGNKHCVTWEKIRNGKEGCSTYSKDSSGYSSSSVGKFTVK